MRDYATNFVCFLLGVCLFVTIARIYPVSQSNEEYNQRIEKEGIISKTKESEYPKHLDGRFFTMGSIVIPVAAFLFWYAQYKVQRIRRIYPIATLLWLCCAILL